MLNKFLVLLITVVSLVSCDSKNNVDANLEPPLDSLELEIQGIVNLINSQKDSLLEVPSLRFSNGENGTYAVKHYFLNEMTQLISVEDYANDYVKQTDFYFSEGYPVFINEFLSEFLEEKEQYSERIVYLKSQEVYQAYSKSEFNEIPFFEDTLFVKTDVEMDYFDFNKPLRAIQQKGEFEMYFDEFLLIEPQSYIIVENADSTINAALFIKSGDSLLNNMFEEPERFAHKKLWVNHYFEEMNGIERMIYNGAYLIK